MHLLSIHDLDDEGLRRILDQAADFKQDLRKHHGRLAGRIVCAAFFEPSTRTRLSFEAAAHHLGADVIGFSEAGTTSAAKGESLRDTIRVLSGYSDVIVLRHPANGAAAEAAAATDTPVINAGDGSGEHPTQTLVDLFTLQENLGGLEGKKVAVVGDLLHGRTVHSLVPALRRSGAEVVAVPAPGLGLPEASADGVPEVRLDDAADADALYVTRVQKERFTDPAAYEAATGALQVRAEWFQRTGSKAIVLHPLPRLDELSRDVDLLPSAKYFEQAQNGVPVRMAVLASLIGEST